MEITKFYKNSNPESYSDSIANSGNEDIGHVTWDNAVAGYEAYPLVNADNRGDIESYFLDFGAWDKYELQAMTLPEINGLLLQYIAGDIKEKGDMTWEKYQLEAEAGSVCGNLFNVGDKVYFSIE